MFVHSSWRTSSTWLWAKLRQAPTTIAYNEIFHEMLNSLTIDHMRGDDFAKWNSKHPEIAPYFLEFAQLVEPGGVMRGYDRSMAFERFIPQGGLAGSLSAAERAYVGGLIENARRRRNIPVLTDTRTLGRFRALAEAFPGRHVLLVRNLFHQWGSYTEQWARGNNYFMDMLFKTIDGSSHDRFVKLLSDWFADEDRSPNSARTFQLFLLFHLYLYAHAFDSADLVVDVNRIAAEPEHRVAIEQALSEYVRSAVDLSDARAPFGLSLFSIPSKSAFVDAIDQFVKQMIDGSISDDAARFLTRAKDESLAEWERQEFYNRTFRDVFLRRPRLAEQAANSPAALPAGSAAEAARSDRSSAMPGPDSNLARPAEPKTERGRPRGPAKRPSQTASHAKPKKGRQWRKRRD